MMSSPITDAARRFPVRVGPTKRYLVDADDAPVLIQGDAAWSLLAAANHEDVTVYLDDCAAKGFNAIIVNLLEQYFAPDPPRNLYGEPPFHVAADFGSPNEAYFANADWVIDEAARRGILVFLCVTYLGHRNPGGYGDKYGFVRPEGWYDEVLANGIEGCHAFGRYVGRRFASFDNIVWMMGGDRAPGEALEHVRAIAEGIQAEDDRHLFCAHVQPEGTPTAEYPDDPWLEITFTYSYQLLHFALLRDYLRQPVLPNLMVEATYERDHNASPVQIRRQAYWPLLCGASGQFMGTLGLFDFAPGWRSLLDLPGRAAQAHLNAVFDSFAWWDLVPDLSHSKEYSAWRDDSIRPFITSGLGELRGNDFCSSARAPDASFAVAYMPIGRPLTVDMTQMAGQLVEATWFDPRDGSRMPAGLWRVDAEATLIPPSDDDWLVILTSVDK